MARGCADPYTPLCDALCLKGKKKALEGHVLTLRNQRG